MNFLHERTVGEAVGFPIFTHGLVLRREATSLPYRASFKRRYRQTTAPRIQLVCKIDKKAFADAFNENVDLAVATEATSRVERHHRRFAGSKDLLRLRRYFFFETTGAQRADCVPILADEHARSGPSIT